MKINIRDGRILMWWLGIAVLTLLTFLIYCHTPLISDDLWFILGTRNLSPGVEKFAAGIDVLRERLITDTLRLANLISLPFLTLWPKWVFNLTASLVVGMNFAVWVKVASVRYGSLRGWIVIAMMLLCLPWYDYYFTVMFSLNYLFTMLAIGLTALCLLRVNDSWQTGKMVLAVILCFAAGWMHEGFSMPMTGAALILAIYKWRNSQPIKNYLILTFALGAGASLILLSPMLWERAEEGWRPGSYPLKELIMQWGPWIMMTLAAMTISLIAGLNRKTRDFLLADPSSRQRWLLIGCNLILSMCVVLKYYNAPRAASAVIISDIVIIAMGLKPFTRLRIAPRVKSALSFIIFLALSLHLGFVIDRQREIERQHNDVIALYQASKSGTIYYDLIYPGLDPSLFKTTVRELHERIPLFQLGAYWGDDSRPLKILPPELIDLANENPRKANSSEEAYIFKGYILLAGDTAYDSDMKIEVRNQHGQWQPSRYRRDLFHDPQGREWTLILPHLQVLDKNIRISDVRLKNQKKEINCR